MQTLIILLLNLISLGAIVLAGMIGITFISIESDPFLGLLLYFLLFLPVVLIVNVSRALKSKVRNYFESKSHDESMLMKSVHTIQDAYTRSQDWEANELLEEGKQKLEEVKSSFSHGNDSKRKGEAVGKGAAWVAGATVKGGVRLLGESVKFSRGLAKGLLKKDFPTSHDVSKLPNNPEGKSGRREKMHARKMNELFDEAMSLVYLVISRKYKESMDEDDATLLAAGVTNYLFGKPLDQRQVDRFTQQKIKNIGDDIIQNDMNMRRLVVASLRVLSDIYSIVGRDPTVDAGILSKYGRDYPDTPDPETYLALIDETANSILDSK